MRVQDALEEIYDPSIELANRLTNLKGKGGQSLDEGANPSSPHFP